MRISDSVEIEAPAQQVWDVLSDIESWAVNVATVDDARVLTALPLGPDSEIRLDQGKLGKAVWTITEWDPPAFFALSNKSGGVTTIVEHRVTAVDDGRSQLELTVETRGLLAPVIALLAKKTVSAHVAAEALDIKRAAER